MMDESGEPAGGGGHDGQEPRQLDLAATEPPPEAEPAPAPQERAWSPEPAREQIRGVLAVGLVVILALMAAASFVLMATGLLEAESIERLLQLLFTPLLALTGTAIGFYFGGQSGQARQRP